MGGDGCQIDISKDANIYLISVNPAVLLFVLIKDDTNADKRPRSEFLLATIYGVGRPL